MSPGPILIGIDGTHIDSRSREHLLHPAVGGVVLFSRNFNNIIQITELTEQIREIRQPRLLICIDQEGGRVQRLREGFTSLPSLGLLGRIFQTDPDQAMDLAYRHARVMAGEVLACGIDLSFAPVLDLDCGSAVIGDRSLSPLPEAVIRLGRAYLAGMHDAGMKTTGKHYPGHGSVCADSHTQEVVDHRSLSEMEAKDLAPFAQLAGELDAMMIAHVTYPNIDDLPAGYSRVWLQRQLRGKLGYTGVILSDDLGMQAAHVVGDLNQRVSRSLEAGCDLVLVCQPDDVEKLLSRPELAFEDAGEAVTSLYGTSRLSRPEMEEAASLGVGEWRQWQISLNNLSKLQGV